MMYLPDTNACITLLRQRNPKLMARWQSRLGNNEWRNTQ
jgi:predicted nucleic acid-binding protein